MYLKPHISHTQKKSVYPRGRAAHLRFKNAEKPGKISQIKKKGKITNG